MYLQTSRKGSTSYAYAPTTSFRDGSVSKIHIIQESSIVQRKYCSSLGNASKMGSTSFASRPKHI